MITIPDTSIMIFFFYGDNSFEITEAVNKIKTQYISKTGSDTDMEIFDMSERNFSDLLNSLAVVPMFVTSRLIIVKDLAGLKISKEKCEQILDGVASSTNIVFVDTQIDRRSVYFKIMSKLKNAKEFKNKSTVELISWIKKRIDLAGATADNRTISLLIDMVGQDQWQLDSEIKKLANYSNQIGIEDLKKLVAANINYNAFEMIDNIVKRNSKKALEIYQSLKANSEPDQKILGAITYQYRVLVLAKDNQGQSNAWIKKTKTSPYAATKAQNIIRSLDMSQLKKAYQLIVEADFNTKQGLISSSDALENLIVKLCKI